MNLAGTVFCVRERVNQTFKVSPKMAWLSRSPDLNPKLILWGYMKCVCATSINCVSEFQLLVEKVCSYFSVYVTVHDLPL